MNSVRVPKLGKQPKDLAEAGDLKAALVALVRDRDHVSFIEVERLFGPYMPTEGEHALEPIPAGGKSVNIIVWLGMSQQFFDLIRECLSEGLIRIVPCPFWIYVIDGKVPSLPVARRVPKGGYKEPHWAPGVMRLGEGVT